MKSLHFLLALILHSCGQPKVSQFDFHLLVEQHVAEFEVPMDDAVAMDVTAAIHQVHHMKAGLWLRQCLTAL